MTDRYVGIGGNDGNSGLTWALRKLTLDGAEDTPIVAGDTVYVGPGVYRETLDVDIAGTPGNSITYIGDVTGENTDGVGGIVRLTGSDDDEIRTRGPIIDSNVDKHYRTFRGFYMDMSTGYGVYINGGNNWIIEDCVFAVCHGGVNQIGANQDDLLVRRCRFMYLTTIGINISHSGTLDNIGHLIENCIFHGSRFDNILIARVGGGTIRNCTILNGSDGIEIGTALTGGQQWDVNNCILMNTASSSFEAENLGEIIEDYNAVYYCQNRVNVATGANSEDYPVLFDPQLLLDGFQFPWWHGELSEWTPIRAITGTGEASDDLLGITRPTTSAKNSWGAMQFRDAERETGTTRGASDASIALHDAGVHQIFVPVTNVSTDIEVYVYREANYAGTLPRMVIKQPGIADDVTTDVAAASQWNLLTTTLTPDPGTDFVIVELQSLNTAAAGNYKVFFDDLVVS